MEFESIYLGEESAKELNNKRTFGRAHWDIEFTQQQLFFRCVRRKQYTL